MSRLLCTAVLTLSVGTAVAEGDVDMKQLAPNQFELTFTSTTVVEIEDAQAFVIPTAESLCQGQHAQLGRYRFSRNEGLGQENTDIRFELVQEISCVDEVAAAENTLANSVALNPSNRTYLEQRIRSMSADYFEKTYSGRYTEAFEMLSAEMQTFRGFEEWWAQMDDFRAEAGPVVAINVHSITIYNNPPNAPRPGLYIAADYQNSLMKAPFHCGYLVWFRGEAGEFQIIREESGLLTNETIKQIPEEDYEKLLAHMRCNAR